MKEQAIIRGSNVPDTELDLTISEPQLLERLLKATALLLGMLTLTGLAALVPILHLIAVPVMLLLTFIVVSRALRQTKVIEKGEGRCPFCHAPFRVLRRKLKLPFTDVCEACHRQVTIAPP